jgi:hypothetical protein
VGLIYCDVHGEQGIIPSISLSLFDIIFSGVSGEELDVYIVKCIAYDDEEFLADFEYFLSKDEFYDKGIKYEYLIKTEKDELLFDEVIPDCTWVYLGLRVLFVICYAKGLGLIRSLVFVASMLCCFYSATSAF